MGAQTAGVTNLSLNGERRGERGRGIQIEKERWTEIMRGRKYFILHADSRALIYIKNNHTHSNNDVLIL